MGILNLTRDSFSDGGEYLCFNRAVDRALEREGEGALIIDVGGESTRPGADPVEEETEKRRVIPVIEELALKRGLNISCDTSKPSVARQALEAGAVMINDVTGMGNPAMREAAAKKNAAVCIMHMKGTPRSMQDNPLYGDVVKEIRDFLHHRARLCEKDSIDREKIILDPGIGFGKRVEDNLEIVRNIKNITSPFPSLAGASRKSFIGALTGSSVGERLAGSIGCASYLALEGVDIIRVHDVKETADAIKMIKALKKEKDE